MPTPECNRFEKCEAILCPMDKVPCLQWFPDEPVCGAPGFGHLHWLKVQKRIARKGADPDYFFSISMLSEIRWARKGTRGANPKGNPIKESKRWVRALRKSHQKGLLS